MSLLETDIGDSVRDIDRRRLAILKREKRRRRGKTDLHYLCKEILGYRDLSDPDGFHGEYCRHLEDESSHFKLSLTPRGSLKTSVGTIGHPIKDILNNPNIRILLASKVFTNSVAILGEIKGHFEKNEQFRKVYGDWVGDTWNKSDIVVKQRTIWRKEPTIMCAGVDVTRTGMHYDRIDVDDPHDDLNTQNQDQIDKVIRWYRLLFSLLDPGGYLYIKGTIWHYNDLYWYIINKERERAERKLNKRFDIFVRPAFDSKYTQEDLINDDIPEDAFLWPERLNSDFLRDTLLEQGPYIFSCQYLLNPIDDETAVFKRSWLKTCSPESLPDRLQIYTSVDPMRDEEGKDYLSIVTVGMDREWQCYILDVRRVKADEHETVDQMIDIYKIYRPVAMGFESVAWQKSYKKYVQLLAMMRGVRLPIRELKTDTKTTKRFRIKSMVPFWKAGLFTLVVPDGDLSKAKGGMAVLIDELTRYPKVANDDTIDALSYVNQLCQRPSIVQILKKISPKSFRAIRNRLRKPKGKLGRHNVRESRRAIYGSR